LEPAILERRTGSEDAAAIWLRLTADVRDASSQDDLGAAK